MVLEKKITTIKKQKQVGLQGFVRMSAHLFCIYSQAALNGQNAGLTNRDAFL